MYGYMVQIKCNYEYIHNHIILDHLPIFALSCTAYDLTMVTASSRYDHTYSCCRAADRATPVTTTLGHILRETEQKL